MSTLAELRESAQLLYDIAGSAVLSDPQWDRLLNTGYRKLWAKVVAVLKYFRVTPLSFTLVGTTQTQALPADFREVLRVVSDPGTDNQRILTRYGDRIAQAIWERSYRVEGTNVVVEPAQRSAGSYRLDYIPECPVLAADTDTVDAELAKFEDALVYYAVIAAQTREETDAGGFTALLTSEYADAARWASDQRDAEPDTVDDVRSGSRGWSWGT